MAEIKSNSLLFWLGDPYRPTRDSASEAYRFTGGKMWWIGPTILGVLLLGVTAVGGIGDPQRFYFSYLVGWTFCLTITLGSLFFVLIQHLTKAQWSVAVRRIPEALIWAFPLLAVLSAPIFVGMHDLYHWTHHELLDPASPEYDPLIAGKHTYLNVPFFVVRIVLYFLIWTFVSFRLYALSLKQDVQPDAGIPAQQRKVGAYGLVLFALTTAFSSYDLLMSLDPHWFSTIFGVYFFAGSFLSAIAMIALSALIMQRTGGMLKGVVTTEHYHDLGKFLFGFIVFWAYIAFSQYMLIWYGGIPEETVWYRHRLEHGWEYHSAALLFVHFIVPFVAMLPRASKRVLPVLSVMCVWMLVMHWFDLHWIAMPVLDIARDGHAGFHWLDFTSWLGLFSLYFGCLMYRLSRHSLVPQNDPNLGKSLRFMNA